MIIIKRDLATRNKYLYKVNYVDSPFESMRKRRNICTYEEIETFAMEPLSKYIMYDEEFRSLRVLSRILLIAIIADAKRKVDSAYGSRVYYFKKSEIDYESFIGVKRSSFRNLFDELLVMEYIVPVDIDNRSEIEKISAMGLVICVEDDGKKIKKLILDSIKSAKSCISIAVPWFTDKDIIDALNQKKNIRIDIIISDEGWNRVDQLEKFNLKIIARDDTNMMHHKFCIIDNNFVVCGSYNYTYNAIRNKEFVVKLEGKQVVEAFNNIFDRLKKFRGNC